jgi:hypothetical protein
MVTVVVGPESSEEEFRIHIDLAKRHSDIMVSQIDISPTTENPKLRITVDFAHHLKLFVAFLYTGRVYSILEDVSERPQEWRLLTELWSLGHDLGSTTFRDAVVDAMVHTRATTSTQRSDVYKFLAKHLQTQTQVQTGVGKLLVDIAVSTRNHEIYTCSTERSSAVWTESAEALGVRIKWWQGPWEETLVCITSTASMESVTRRCFQ